MTNRKTTKRALLSSILALVLCFAMLLGTTFAWFTDTATTSVNTIQAGTLDVALEMQNAQGEWVSAEGQTLNFKTADNRTTDILWEPGCTYNLPTLRIVNKGNLALKYKLAVTGIQGDAKLNEVIKWEVGIETTDFSGTHTNWSELGEYNSNMYLVDQVMNPVDKEVMTAGVTQIRPVVFTIRGHMNETAGNEYQGLSIEGIAITVVATQAAVENDSNGRTYDENATYPILNIEASAATDDISAKIDEALASGSDTLTLKVADAEASTTVTLAPADFGKVKNLTIDLGDNVVLNVSDNSRCIVPEGSTLKVTGKGTIGNGTDWLAACGGATIIIDNEGGFVRNSTGAATIRMASYGANVIIRNYDISNTDDRHPLITVGDMDSVVSPNGCTTPSKLTLENVTMNNIVYSETAGSWVPGGQGIQMYQGSLEVTTSNVTFNGSSDLVAVKGPMSTDTAFLVVNNSASVTAEATLNGVAVQ